MLTSLAAVVGRLLRDRDAPVGKGFVVQARAIGIEPALSPFRCPQANGIAERMVGTFRRHCLDQRVLNKHVEYYNRSRPHRSLDLNAPPPEPRLVRPPRGGRVAARPVLGGLHHEYSWEAA